MKLKFTLLTIFVLLFFPQLTFAFGTIIDPDFNTDRWRYVNIKNKEAFIKHNDGREELLLNVEMEDRDNRDVIWVIPIPATAEDINVKALEDNLASSINFPASAYYCNIITPIWTSHLYPILFLGGSAGELCDVLKISNRSSSRDKPIAIRAEEDGVTSEIVSARDWNGLEHYFAGKNLSIKASSITSLQPYLSDKFSFVIFWIKSPEASKMEHIARRAEEYMNTAFEQDISVVLKKEKNIGLCAIIKKCSSLNPGERSECLRKSLPSKMDAPFFCPEKLGDDYFGRLGKWYVQVAEKYPEFAVSTDPLAYLKSSHGTAARQEFKDSLIANSDVIKVNYVFDRPSSSDINSKITLLTFPTDKIFLPLGKMRVGQEGDSIAEVPIRISGQVKLDNSGGKSNRMKSENFVEYSYSTFGETFQYSNRKLIRQIYTKFDIGSLADNHSAGLWFLKYFSLKTFLISLPVFYPGSSAIILLIFSSFISGSIAGLIIFRRNILKYGLMGLSNCFSIFGLIGAIMISKTRETSEETRVITEDPSKKRYIKFGRLSFVLYVFFLPLLFTSVVGLSFPCKGESCAIKVLFFYPMLLSIIAILMAVGFRLGVKKSGALFYAKSVGYSSWTFRLPDRRKYIFIIVFSILFLLISGGIIMLLKMAEAL